MRRVLPFLAFLAVTTAPAPAQPVDDAGAARIVESLSRYVGRSAFEKRVLDVSVDGDAYRLTVDFDALAAMVPETAALSLDLDPFTVRMKPQADGTFAASGAIAPNGSLSFRTPATELSPSLSSRVEWSLEQSGFTGVFDPELATFSVAQGTYRGLQMVSADDNQRTDIASDSGTFETTAARSAGGGVDYETLQTMVDVAETVTMRALPEGPQMSFSLTLPKLTAVTEAKGFQVWPLLDIAAFAVAHADKAAVAADQAELKRLILAALPFWDRISVGYDASDVTVETSVGRFGIASLAFALAIDGAADDGAVDYGFGFKGLSLPSGLAPAWSAPLLPTDVSLNFGVRNLNSEEPIRLLVDAFDPDRQPPIPDAVGQDILAEFLGDPPVFVMERSLIRNGGIEIAMTGEMPFSLGKPSLTATIEMAGFETAASALQAAAAVDPGAQQAFPFVLAAQGLARKLEDGRLQWNVELNGDGSIVVNGARLKGPDPI